MSSAVLSTSLFFLLSSVSHSGDDTNLIRRLNEANLDPTNHPTKSPTINGCQVSWAGDVAPLIENPSTVSMGLVHTGTASVDQHDIDLEGGDTNLDGDNAKVAFCEAKFGAGSRPVTPEDSDTFAAMVNLCESMGGGKSCYLGLYREDYNDQKTDCDTWRGEAASFTVTTGTLSSTYGTFGNNQPSCPWLAATDPKYDASAVKHCLQYKTNTNKMVVARCTADMYVICEFSGICNP